MSDVTCIRCGQTRESVGSAPYPDELGQAILDQVCAPCWQECKDMQVMVINEYRLDLSDPRAHEILEKTTREFLGLPAPAGADSDPA